MLHTTLNLCKENHACTDGYNKLSKYLGADFDKDELIPLTTILKSNNFNDTLWCLHRATVEDSKLLRMEFSAWCARQVLHIYEEKYPDDDRVRKCLDAVDGFVLGNVTEEEIKISRSAAYAAADAAYAAYAADAAYAAYAAAYAAADAAAARKDMRKSQEQKLTEMLEAHKVKG